MSKKKLDRDKTRKEALKSVLFVQKIVRLNYILIFTSNILLFITIYFGIKGLVIPLALISTIYLVISFYITLHYQKKDTFSSQTYLFVGEYPTEENFSYSLLSMFGFRSSDYKTYKYTFNSDPTSYIMIRKESRVIEWHFSEKPECFAEISEVISNLVSFRLAVEISIPRSLQETIHDQKKLEEFKELEKKEEIK